MQNDYQSIILSLNRLHEVVSKRLQMYFNKEESLALELPKPDTSSGESALQRFALQYEINTEEYIVLLIACIPHLQPNFFDSIIQTYLPGGGDLPEIGGVKTGNHRGMQPTAETALFVLAGTDLQKRLEIQQMLMESALIKDGILFIEPVKDGEPKMSGRLMITQEWIDRLLFGKEPDMKFSPDFPAKQLTTQMTWDDLVLTAYTQEQINDIIIWLHYHKAISDDKVLGRKIKPGYRILFHGPPGTGKTLTAALLGKQFDKEVYRVDISQMVSKYIGETEKNLEKVFSKAEHKDWILFFDEADALFGKRTNVQSSHDRYANQEVSYLLQRVEDYPGLLILASNFKSNMDEAFVRRFHSIIHFPPPKAADRLKLWQKTWPANYKIDPLLNLIEIADKYELNGSTIVNIIHYATLKAASRDDEFIRQSDITDAIRREFRKEERTMS